MVRNIQPSTICFSDEDCKVIFSDVSRMCKEGEMRNRDLDSHAPYNAFSIDEEGCLDNSSYEIDFWSVGIVVFEIIAGTELVIPAVTATEVEVLLQMCEPYMDDETVQLL